MFPPYGLDIDKIFEGLTVPFACFFKRNLFTTSAVNPPADIRLPATSAALLMQNGHIGPPSAELPFTANALLPLVAERGH